MPMIEGRKGGSKPEGKIKRRGWEMKGRKPKPSALHLVEKGKLPQDRKGINEPKPRAAELTCPEHLGPIAKKYWKKEAPKLKAVGLLTEIDTGPFELLCEAYGNWMEYKKLLKDTGISIRTPNGSLQISPAAVMVNRAYDQYKKMCVEFGMTPSSRSRISVGKPPDEDGIKKFIK